MPSPRPPYAFPTPVSIAVTPDPATIDEEGSVQFTAIATLDDGTTADYTHNSSLLWHSSDPAVATINSGFTSGGIAFGVGPGATNITANWISVMGGTIIGVPASTTPDDDPTGVVSPIVELDVTAATPVPDPDGRFNLAFDSSTLEPNPAWTRMDTIPNLVTSYTIDRGRAYELDRTDTGRATVTVIDPDGVLDPTVADTTSDYLLLENGVDQLILEDSSGLLLLETSSATLANIRPLMQATLGRYDPVADEWKLRFRGWVEDFDYQVDPSQRFNRLVVSLVDLFEVLSAAEMQPGEFGDPGIGFDVGAEITPPEGSEGQIYFAPDMTVGHRINTILANARISKKMRVVADGAVTLWQTVYSAGESPLAAIQEAADAEMPGVGNVYVDRRGRIRFDGRQARLTPSSANWKAGDAAAITASPTDTAQIRELGFNRGLSRLINSATATPVGVDDDDVHGQLVIDTDSIDQYGIRSWSATNLLTKTGPAGASLIETKKFASFYVANYAEPRDRITNVSFRALRPDDPRAEANWDLLATVDIADTLELTSATGGGGSIDEGFFVEGIHEEARPLHPDYDDVTVRLDLSPRAYYETDPWA